MAILDFIIKTPLSFDLIFISIGLIGLLWCMLDCFKIKRTTPLERELKQLEEEKKANIKWQIERNLKARKRRNAIHDLAAAFDYMDIMIDENIDRNYVIIKINKNVLREREVK